MKQFKQLPENRDIHTLIKTTFDADIPVTGAWGYTPEEPTVIHALPEGMTLPQLQHMLSTIRAHLEMNITQEADERYGAINANERTREEIKQDVHLLSKVGYEVTGMKEDLYNAFIKEYKANYGKEDFDLNAHFKRRKEATLTREIVHYFDISALQ